MGRWTVAVLMAGVAGGVLCVGCAPPYRDPVMGVEARYEWETLRAKLDQPISTVYSAARDAVDELDLRCLRAHEDGIAAEILALDAQLDTVTIRLESLPDPGSLLTIRIGAFHGKDKSIFLFEQIMRDLARREDTYGKYRRPRCHP